MATSSANSFTIPEDAEVHIQPLYVSNLSIPNLGTRNVLFVTTMNNSVYAFDADSGAQLWTVNLAAPALQADLDSMGIWGGQNNYVEQGP